MPRVRIAFLLLGFATVVEASCPAFLAGAPTYERAVEVSLAEQEAVLDLRTDLVRSYIQKGIIDAVPLEDELPVQLLENRVLQRNRYVVRSVQRLLPPPPWGDTPFLSHHRAADRLAKLHRLGYRLVLNPSLQHVAFFSISEKAVFLGPLQPFAMLEHEFAHVIFDVWCRGLLPPELEEEFQKELLFIAQVATGTRFTVLTLTEIFAAVREARALRRSKEPILPGPDNVYLATYLRPDLERIGPENWNLAEQQWAAIAGLNADELLAERAAAARARRPRRWMLTAGLGVVSVGLGLGWKWVNESPEDRTTLRTAAMTATLQAALAELGAGPLPLRDPTVNSLGRDFYSLEGRVQLPEGTATVRATFRSVTASSSREVLWLEGPGPRVLELVIPGRVSVDLYKKANEAVYFTLPTLCVGRCDDFRREFSLVPTLLTHQPR